MKSNLSTLAVVAVLALAGTSSFAGSGNDANRVAAPAAQIVSAPATTVSETAKDAFDPQINVRMGNTYTLLSV